MFAFIRVSKKSAFNLVLKKLAPILQPVKSKPKPIVVTCSRSFSRALRQLRVFALTSA